MSKRLRPRPRTRPDTPERRRCTAELVQRTLATRDWEPLTLATQLDVSEQAVRSWAAGEHAPSPENLRALQKLCIPAGKRPPTDLVAIQQLRPNGSFARLRVGDWLDVQRQTQGGYLVEIGRWTFLATPGQNGTWDVASCGDT